MAPRPRLSSVDERPTQLERLSRTSPFQNPDLLAPFKAMIRRFKSKERNHMGIVLDSKGHKHVVRVDCQHWAPAHNAQDCRFQCEKREREARA